MPDTETLVRISYLQWLALEDKAESDWVGKLRDYYDGRHPVYLTDRQKEFIGLWAKDSEYLFSDNYCALVVDIPAERLEVIGFTVESDEQAAQAALAWDWWQGSYFDSRQDDLFAAALRDGEAYVTVSFDNGDRQPRWDVDYKFDGEAGVKLHRHPDTGKPMFASKRWTDFDPSEPGAKPIARLTLYFPDRVEKYRMATRFDSSEWREAGWAPYVDNVDEEGEAIWPIPWTDVQGESLGLPVIPFTCPGGPKINAVYALQDVLNKSLLDLIAAADYSGFPIAWATGVDTPVDASGNAQPVTISPGRLLRGPTGASFGRLPGEDPQGLLNTCSFLVQEIAGKARIPQYLFQRWGAEPPTGESLKSQEVGLISQVGRMHKDFGAAFRQLIELSAAVDQRFNGSQTQADPSARIEAQWKNAQIRSLDEMDREAEAKRKAGVPEERILQEVWGYSAEEATQFAQAQKARREEAMGKAVMSFLQGQQQNGGGTQPPGSET